MKINYTITESEYQEVIEYQMTLERNKFSRIIRYFGLNVIFLGLAVYFFISREQYGLAMRVAPLIMAVILCLLSSYQRYCIPRRAKSAVKRYVNFGTIQKGYFGQHILMLKDGCIKVNYGGQWNEIDCGEVGRIERLKSISLIIARGVIFEIIPNQVLEVDNRREMLLSVPAKETGVDSRHQETNILSELKESIIVEESWPVEMSVYLRGIVQGHRTFYTTISAWRGRSLICALILIYGIGVLASGLNIYLGLAFTLVGILINRQLISAFTPLAYLIARQQLVQMVGLANELGAETLYMTKDELSVTCCGQVQRARLENVKTIRKNKEYAFIYTDNNQMFVIPRDIFETKMPWSQFRKVLQK